MTPAQLALAQTIADAQYTIAMAKWRQAVAEAEAEARNLSAQLGFHVEPRAIPKPKRPRITP